MTKSLISPSRRRFLARSAIGLGAAGLVGAFAETGATARTRDTVRLTWGPGGLPLYAKQRGEFEKRLKDEGIKVEWLGPFPNHAPTLQAVTGGSADFAFGGSTTPAIAAMIAGSPLVFASFYVYEPRTTAIIAKDDSGINTVADLVGKSVAVNRSGLGEFLLVAALEKNGIDRSKVKFVYLNPPDAAPALASNKVDAWAMWSPGVDIARNDLKAHDLFREDRDLDFQIDFSSFVVSRSFATENADLVRSVIAAYRAEADWASDHPAEAEAIAQTQGKYADTVRDHLAGLKRRYRFFPTTDTTFVGGLQRAADWLAERKVLPEKVTVTDFLAKI